MNITHTNSIDNIKKHIFQNVQDQVKFTSNIFFDDVEKGSNHFDNLKDKDNEVYIILNSVDKYQCDPIRAELAHTEMTKKHIQRMYNNQNMLEFIMTTLSTNQQVYDTFFKQEKKLRLNDEVVKKLAQNIPLNKAQQYWFYKNIYRVNKQLFNQSKNKQLKEQNIMLQTTPESFKIATSTQSYMMVKNQLMFELQQPNIITEKTVTKFVQDNFCVFCLDSLAVILTQMYIKQAQNSQNDELLVNNLLSNPCQFNHIESNFNMIELYKSIIYIAASNTKKQPSQHNFQQFINNNLCRLYENIVQKEMLLFIFQQSKTYDINHLILTLADNVDIFFDNIQGINIIKAVFEHHTLSTSYSNLYNSIQENMHGILATRQLNQLQFYFLEKQLFPKFDHELLCDCSDKKLQDLGNLLMTKVGQKSINEAIKFQGYDKISAKMEQLSVWIQKNFISKKRNLVEKSISKLTQSQKNNQDNNNSKPKSKSKSKKNKKLNQTEKKDSKDYDLEI